MDEKQLEFFYEIMDASLPRLGPGDDASTRKALIALLARRPPQAGAAGAAKLRVLDIGCGNGAQTMQLALHSGGKILAVDNHEPFLKELRHRAEAAGVSDAIETCLRDMRKLEMAPGSFDLIWSEGALYFLGFLDGLEICRELLAPGGLIGVSELCWLRRDPPAECRGYFAEEYPAISDIPASLAAIRARGYEIVNHFTLPESSWWESYYAPLEERLRSLRQKHAAEPWKIEMIECVQEEIDLYRRYSSWYGYEFYLMQRE